MVLTLAALGVVYGDIGTSPLYAFRECFHSSHGMVPDAAHVLGVLSLIFWSLVAIVSLKYLVFVMRADNRGEGGILALMSLAMPETGQAHGLRRGLVLCGVFGAALLYGDGMITPSISVLSAMEGMEVATNGFDPYILPGTIAVLIGLFTLQRLGTGRVGALFGPVMLLWFATLAWLGVAGIVRRPEVLAAMNPWHGIQFLLTNGKMGFVVVGAVFLVVTGAEALYADMGHFGLSPIRRAWFALVLPALVLNYFGQGALVLGEPAAVVNPFYLLAPRWALYPLVALATAATVIASQALISGAYSLTMQAIQLGYLPRLGILHTSSDARGQIYMPQINWFLMFACIGLVVGFGSSSRLAAAYGIAVTLTMLATTALFYFAARRLWKWSRWRAGVLCGAFGFVELAFFSANVLKIWHGGWFPLVVAGALFAVMTTWKRGRLLLWNRLQTVLLPRDRFFEDIEAHPPRRVPGTAIFMAGNPHGTPVALLHNIKHNRILHERNFLLTIVTEDVPRVDESARVAVELLPSGFQRIVGHYGFMEQPNVPKLLRHVSIDGGQLDIASSTFFMSRETIVLTGRENMARWRKWLFALMSRNAQTATDYFQIPANRVVELGMQVQF
jgi:KUP system potassium uptake protein